jgi:uncharacterized damage-inducible protein DinB
MSLSSNLTITLQNRKAFKKLLDSLTVEQINHIPNGFNNNILWNCAHVLAVQQSLIYRMSGLPFTIEHEIISGFARGTKPDQYYDEDFIDMVKSLFFTSYDQILQDIDQNKFDNFKPFAPALKFEITDIDTAITFNLYHEAYHMGQIMTIKNFCK